ncbi:S-adenosyl-L-methionine-dependent methyltransferase [Macroventuria anomochaeta]|uniref:S-adenosyl-L-methionine-dependent methyltransferase n=1 Tax=Macroventuria anomochaeta TaxID=301207 RepID=A0ACB6RKQ8_9PLEO|nr:S-adenosyl-L-methionine-dependent methyltransferase [Macroventuria anomochaeta]KAF2622354.1 S-adenosyl-L-methionine-dependent methyltransferase [Macroventuria anomochaeta]
MAAQTTNKPDVDPSVTSAWQTSDVAQRYKAIESATRPFAKIMFEVAERLTTLKSTPVNIFDLGCGTGAVEAEIYAAVPRAQWSDLQVLAGDISQPMLSYLKQRGEEEGWSGLETKVVDGTKLDESDVGEQFTHIFVGFAIFVLPPDTLTKLTEKLQAGGTLAISTWATLPWYSFLARTYANISNGPELPSQAQLWKSMSNGRPWGDVSFLKQQLEEAGLQKVEITQKKFHLECGTPDVCMTTMEFVLGMLSKQWPEEKREGWAKEVAEKMKEVFVQEAGGEGENVYMDFEGIVTVGLKGQ